MLKPQIVSFNLKCRSSGKAGARLASQPLWDDTGHVVAERELWMGAGAASPAALPGVMDLRAGFP